MKYKLKLESGTTMVLLTVISLLVIMVGMLLLLKKDKALGDTIINRESKYDATQEIEEALQKIKTDDKKALVIAGLRTTENKIALTFEGLTDEVTMQKILDVLDEHKMKATFFIPAIGAAEDTDMIRAIVKAKQEIGSYSLTGKKNMQELTVEELVEDYCRANNILKTLTGKAPKLLKCNGTEYTEEVLTAADASNLESVVYSSVFLNHQSFSSYNVALDYVKGLAKGSIVSIKVEGYLDEKEHKLRKEEKPAHDKRAYVAETEKLEELDKEDKQEQLIQVVTWLIQALEETKYTTEFVKDFPAREEESFTSHFQIEKERNNLKLADVYTRVSTSENSVAYSFRDISNEVMLGKVLRFLKSNAIEATFFITGDEIKDYPKRIQKILDEGHTIGNGGLTGRSLTEMTFEEVCFEIYSCEQLLKKEFDVTTHLFMPALGKYNTIVREAASAFNYVIVTYSKNPITNKDGTVDEIMDYYKNGFEQGDIIYFSLNYHKDVEEVIVQTYGKVNTLIYRIVGVNTLYESRDNTENVITLYAHPYENYSRTNNTSQAMNLLSEDNEIHMKFKSLRSENKGKLAEPIHTVYTTEQAVAYIFYGISNEIVVDDVLQKLARLDAKGTFFVTTKEIEEYPTQINKIIKAGHEVGIGIIASSTSDYYMMCNQIYAAKQYLKGRFNIETDLVKQPWGEIVDETKEAVSAMNCKLITHYGAVVQVKDEYETSADYVMKTLFAQNNHALSRGQILFFRLNYYKGSDQLLGQLIESITEKKLKNITYKGDVSEDSPTNGSEYAIKGVSSLISNKEKVYNYPLKFEQIIPEVENSISKGQYLPVDRGTMFQNIVDRYIGNPSIKTVAELPGFTEDEVSKLDKTGKIKVEEGRKVIFLTFDDWGTDASINHLLYVLRKHQVKGTFFIKTNYVSANPNLLRAIAEEGHDIASHTHYHRPLADYDRSTKEYISITLEEKSQLQEDIIISYNALKSIIGDIKNEKGRAVLTNMFRPPTLAISRFGIEAVLESGYGYIVNGSFSTHDYEAESAEQLKRSLTDGIVSKGGGIRRLEEGSVVVMHMSDESKYTAQAIDAFLSENEMKEENEKYTFARLGDYLKEGYRGY